MGRSRRTKDESFIAQAYETMPGEKAHCPVYDCMLRSDAFTDLTIRQRMLYVVCKAQTWGHAKPTTKIDGQEVFQGQEYFYLSCEDVKAYSIYGQKNKRDFYRDMKALREHGFISLVSNGKRMKHKNIYKLDKAWQQWEQPT